jgi:hypothetical protein
MDETSSSENVVRRDRMLSGSAAKLVKVEGAPRQKPDG